MAEQAVFKAGDDHPTKVDPHTESSQSAVRALQQEAQMANLNNESFKKHAETFLAKDELRRSLGDGDFQQAANILESAGSCFLLGLRFIFAGASALKQWDIETTDGFVVICRRIGALYLGLALMLPRANGCPFGPPLGNVSGHRRSVRAPRVSRALLVPS